jgi:cob(I)alamin adenosyltransferase
MKVYTGSGDQGRTSLLSGERVLKSHLRIEACGDIDELNSLMGVLAAILPEHSGEINEEIRQIQSVLLLIGAWFSTTPDAPIRSNIKQVTDKQISFLEDAIDRMENQLPELKNFILPGGHLSAALAHVARSVCRRLERTAVRLEVKNDDPHRSSNKAIVFLNRLSDYLFVTARYCNRLSGVTDSVWKP